MNFKISTHDGFVTEVKFSHEEFHPQNELESKTLEEIEEYLRGERKSFDLPYRFEGTEFQKSVWRELEKIPYGETRLYSEIAKAIGKPNSARAVGSACGKNRICLLIPCHRVVGRNGLCGFTEGVEVKQQLLDLEKNIGR